VHTINTVVFATATVGWASAAVCLVIVSTIVAHGHDRVSMRDRIVVGLMMANAVYSTANAIPLNALRTGVIDCGRLAMSFDVIRLGRALWFCGKYGLVGFELLILGASIRAMHRGSKPVSRCTEAAMHAACWTLVAIIFAVFYTLCARINANGYNVGTETEAYTNSYFHANANDDVDDDTPSIAASSTFHSQRDAYDDLVRNMLVAWDIVVGVAVGLWIVLRVLHLQAIRSLRTEAAAAALAEAADVWADTRRSAWGVRRRLLEARQEAFNEVAKPLEPYIIVFVLFAVPAVVMSTPFCRDNSGAHAYGKVEESADGSGYTSLSYGTCFVWCEFALAFRSLATAAVYLISRKRRAEVVAVGSTWRKLCTRVIGCALCMSSPSPYASLRRNGSEYNDYIELTDVLDPQRPENNSTTVAVSAVDLSSWRVNVADIDMEHVLGEGGFGEVWAGRLLPKNELVAIKLLLAGAFDTDGDPVNPMTNEDFRKECTALQSLDCPHLIKFVGFGTTAEGNGFIVTELMSGGSLEDALHDYGRVLSWRMRLTFGTHVAMGMEYLHKKHMLHRDLKSANVLLNEQRTEAKICDFGLSRIIRPAHQRVVHSPFTGSFKIMPKVDGVEINAAQRLPAELWMAHTGVDILNAHGTMTKAAGTLLWMAPEVFRGDQNYTKAVDVYSFGIVLWELATRKVPWVGELPSDQLGFFHEFNRALQTGRRPAIPGYFLAEHGAYVALMQRCWAGDPADRPGWSDVARGLSACLSAVPG
jgi:hypothetical protein